MPMKVQRPVPMPAVGERNIREGSTDVARDATGTSNFSDERKAFA